MSEKPALTHQNENGAVHMVDISHKAVTKRVAKAWATLNTRPDVIELLASGNLPKGEALALTRVAGIQGAKQTANLIPLCHPLFLTGVEVSFEIEKSAVKIYTTVSTKGETGVEMEALTAAAVAALTLFDMVKAVDPQASITDIEVLSKTGGKTGTWERNNA